MPREIWCIVGRYHEGLVFFIPLAALAPVLQGYFLLNHGLPPLFLWPVATHALVGALLDVYKRQDDYRHVIASMLRVADFGIQLSLIHI